MKTATFVYAFLVFKFVYPFFVRYFHAPSVTSLASNAFLIAVFLLGAITRPTAVKKPSSGYYLDVGLLIVLIVASGILNSAGWYLVAKSMIDLYIPGLVLFLILTSNNMTEDELRRALELCYALIFLQIPVSLGQYAIGHYGSLDSNSGTISASNVGGTGINAILESFLAARFVSKAVTESGRGRVKYLLLAASTMIPVLVGGARFGLLLIPMVVITLLLATNLTNLRNSRKGVVAVSFLAVIMGVVVVYFIRLILADSAKLNSFLALNVVTDPAARAAYDSDPTSGRIADFGVVYSRLLESWHGLLFGLGSDAVEQSQLMTVGNYWPHFFNVRLSTGVSFFAGLGYSGLAFLAYFFVKGVIVVVRNGRLHTSSFVKTEELAFVGMNIACMASSIYTDIWSSQAGLVYCTTLAVLVTGYRAARRQRRVELGGRPVAGRR